MHHTNLSGFLMGTLAIFCLVLVLVYLRKALARTHWPQEQQWKIFTRTTGIIVAWVLLLGALALRGFFTGLRTLPPRPVIAILLPLPVVIFLAFSRPFRTLALAIPSHWLVFVQSFRIVVELLLWLAFVQNLVPVQMTFEGRNFDILAGLLALAAGWALLRRKRWAHTAAVAYNIIGLGLLLNIMTISLLSMPTPLRYFMNEPSLEAVGRFPFIYLPTVLVVLAYSFHIFSLRQLALKKQAAAPKDTSSSGTVRFQNSGTAVKDSDDIRSR